MTATRIIACLLISITANTYAEEQISVGQEKSASCQGCHGMDGNSFSPEWPNLASQHPAYIIKQIQDFKSGARQDPTMSAMVAALEDTDIPAIAAYFSAQTLRPTPGESSTTGKKLYQGGNSYSRVPACTSCHAPSGKGNAPAQIPLLAGQKAGYTAKTLRDFKAGTRGNDRNKIMQDIAAKLSENEIDAVATYIATMLNQ